MQLRQMGDALLILLICENRWYLSSIDRYFKSIDTFDTEKYWYFDIWKVSMLLILEKYWYFDIWKVLMLLILKFWYLKNIDTFDTWKILILWYLENIDTLILEKKNIDTLILEKCRCFWYLKNIDILIFEKCWCFWYLKSFDTWKILILLILEKYWYFDTWKILIIWYLKNIDTLILEKYWWWKGIDIGKVLVLEKYWYFCYLKYIDNLILEKYLLVLFDTWYVLILAWYFSITRICSMFLINRSFMRMQLKLTYFFLMHSHSFHGNWQLLTKHFTVFWYFQGFIHT